MSKILILGATSAIAQETARVYASRGDAMILVGRNQDKLKMLEQDLKIRGAQQTRQIIMDFDDLSCHEEKMNQLFEQEPDIDVTLIAYGMIGNETENQRDGKKAAKVFHTNFISVVSLLTCLSGHYEARKKGVIAVISSVAGDRGRKSNYVYGSSKAALNTYLDGFRARLSRSDVHVLTVKPGFVDTPMTATLKKSALFSHPRVIGRGIVRAVEKKKDVVYLPFYWQLIMMIIKWIPGFLFKRMNF